MAAPALVPGPLPQGKPYQMASLYVGDLKPEINEAILFQKFSSAGPVISIRVCRDHVTKMSLGYAYVNFREQNDAEHALDTMNFDLLLDQPMRIMWSQRDPAMRKSGTGNVFIKNLEKGIDTKAIYDTFSLFGNILSCKVAMDELGKSRGYGFVHFETEEAAEKAIERVNGMLLMNKTVFVGKFQSRDQREKEYGDLSSKFTNVFVKNFGEHLDKEKLDALFSKFGEITSSAIRLDQDGKSKGFGFVAYKTHEEAAKAVEEMNDYELEDTGLKLVVCRAQKKHERQNELRRRHEQVKAERQQRFQGVNLYVKNLADSVDDEVLKKHFEQFGTITSVKVMLDDTGRSKGFGFVCFDKAEQASKAVTDMLNKQIEGKPLYVAIAQRKEDRRAELASHFMKTINHMRYQAGAAIVPQPQGIVFQAPMTRQMPFQPIGPIRQPRAYQQPQQFPIPVQFARPIYQNQRAYRPDQQPRMQNYGPQQVQRGQPGQQRAPGQRAQGQRNAGKIPYAQAAQGQREPEANEQLNSQILAQAAPQEQKQILGEKIYSTIQTYFPKQKEAGKITGMMLEIDNSELLMMLQDQELFKKRFEEAAAALAGSQH